MYQITEGSLDGFLEVAQRLHSKLSTSAFWPMIRDEPIIMEFINSVRELESQVKASKEVKPSTTNVPDTEKS
jgi:hypothetical protein